MDGGRIVDRGTHEELLERCPLYRRDRRVRARRLGLPPARPRGAGGAGAAVNDAGQDATSGLLFRDLWRLVRGEDERGAQGALAAGAAAALPAAGRADVRRAASSRPRRRWRRRSWPGGRSTTGSTPATSTALDLIVAIFIASAVDLLGGELRADLPGRLGRPAGAPGPAPADLRPRAEDVDRLLHPQRSPGVLISRMTNDVQALDQLVTDGIVTLFSSDADAGRSGRDPALARRAAGAGHLPDLPAARDRSVIFRIVAADAYRITRERIADITAYLQETLSGVRVVRSFGQEPRHVDADDRAQRGQPRRRT